MKALLKTTGVLFIFMLISNIGLSQYKMDSDGRTLRNSSNQVVGKIDSDGKTIRNASNSSVGKVDSDGRTIRNSSNSMVLRVDSDMRGIRNSSNSGIAKMSEVMNMIDGAKPEAVYVALWWFCIKNK